MQDWDVALEEQLMVDQAARMSLMSLARMSDDGFNAAEHIIAKMLKKIGEGQAADKPSALVMESCQNARQELEWWLW